MYRMFASKEIRTGDIVEQSLKTITLGFVSFTRQKYARRHTHIPQVVFVSNKCVIFRNVLIL